ncbi:hypothetical protein CYMTET_50810 [Cymbomonas tetramitiformis]|uniref:Uncharacterized protein n=1 Tax=Cymbomonas tetramitiformis TaxID=36881 RepID=A0AAE0BNM5_9CHLO|nr:hypothetical protein CYMTET_50810 [Cymbomonas tetramitiformis]
MPSLNLFKQYEHKKSKAAETTGIQASLMYLVCLILVFIIITIYFLRSSTSILHEKENPTYEKYLELDADKDVVNLQCSCSKHRVNFSGFIDLHIHHSSLSKLLEVAVCPSPDATSNIEPREWQTFQWYQVCKSLKPIKEIVEQEIATVRQRHSSSQFVSTSLVNERTLTDSYEQAVLASADAAKSGIKYSIAILRLWLRMGASSMISVLSHPGSSMNSACYLKEDNGEWEWSYFQDGVVDEANCECGADGGDAGAFCKNHSAVPKAEIYDDAEQYDVGGDGDGGEGDGDEDGDVGGGDGDGGGGDGDVYSDNATQYGQLSAGTGFYFTDARDLTAELQRDRMFPYFRLNDSASLLREKWISYQFDKTLQCNCATDYMCALSNASLNGIGGGQRTEYYGAYAEPSHWFNGYRQAMGCDKLAVALITLAGPQTTGVVTPYWNRSSGAKYENATDSGESILYNCLIEAVRQSEAETIEAPKIYTSVSFDESFLYECTVADTSGNTVDEAKAELVELLLLRYGHGIPSLFIHKNKMADMVEFLVEDLKYRSARYYSNFSSLEQGLNDLLLDDLRYTLNSKLYFTSCDPTRCTYTRSDFPSVIVIFAASLGTMAGLQKFLETVFNLYVGYRLSALDETGIEPTVEPENKNAAIKDEAWT